MKIRSFLWFVFTAALLFGLITFLLFRLQRQYSLLELVPPGARAVLYTPSSSKFYTRLNAATWWASLQKSDYFRQLANDMALLDTLINLSGLSRQTRDLPSSVVMMETAAGEPAFVFYAAVGRKFPYWDLHEKALPRFGSRFELVKRKSAGQNAFMILDRQSGRQLSYTFAKGVAVLSFDREAFELAVGLMGQNRDKDFTGLTSGYSAPASDAVLFFNPAKLSAHLSGLFTDRWAATISDIGNQLGKWLALDLHLRNNELIINGLLDDGPLFEMVDQAQQISIDRLPGLVPVNVVSVAAMIQPKNSETTEKPASMPGLVIGGRAAVAGMAKPFVVFVPEQPAQLGEIVYKNKPRIASPWSNSWTAPVDVGLLPRKLFASALLPFDEPYFAISDGQSFVFSPDLLLLRNYIETASKGLINSDMARLGEVVSARSGLLLYHQISKATGWLTEMASGKLKYRLARDAAVMHGFEMVSAQLSRSGNKVYINVLISSNINPLGQAIPLWSARLGAPGAAAPFVFDDGAEGRVIAFDSAGWMYGFSPGGRQLWKKPVGGIPLGIPVVIDYPGLKRRYFLFNTSSGIFLTDAAGNQAPGFPVRLPSRAMAAAGYAPHDGPAVYVNCADRRTYAFNLSGKPLAGWNIPLLSDISTDPPATASAGGASYVLITTMDGSLKVLDENGLERFRIKEPVSKAEGAGIHLNRTNAKGLFLTSSPLGEIIYIGSGGLSRSPMPYRFSRSHYFLYEDFDADQSPDFVFADGRRFVVFDRFDRVIIEGHLQHDVIQKPLFLTGAGQAGTLCFDFAPEGAAAIVGPSSGLLNFEALPKGNQYGFGRTEANGPLLLAACEGSTVILYRLN